MTHVLLNRARRRARPCDVFLLLAMPICRWSVGVAFCVAVILAGSNCLALALFTLLALRAYGVHETAAGVLGRRVRHDGMADARRWRCGVTERVVCV